MNKSKTRRVKRFFKDYALRVIVAIIFVAVILFYLPPVRSFIYKLSVEHNLSGIVGTTEDYPLNIYFLNVGKADAMILQYEDETVMIDTATVDMAEEIEIILKKLAVEEISMMFLTHPDKDHIGSASHIIDKFSVKEVIQPTISDELNPDSEERHSLEVAIETNGVLERSVMAGEVFTLGENNEVTLSILSPIKEMTSSNNSSLVIKLEYDDVSVLFCGDIEEKAERRLLKSETDLSADVIKIAHHGSDTSSAEEFLEAVNAKYAVITTGPDKNNLPSTSVLERLNIMNYITYRTDIDGMVVLSANGEDIIFTTEN